MLKTNRFCFGKDNEKDWKNQYKNRFNSVKDFRIYAQNEYRKNPNKYNLYLIGFLLLLGILSDRYFVNYEGNEEELKDFLIQQKIDLVTIQNLNKKILQQNSFASIQYYKDGNRYEYITYDWKKLHQELQEIQRQKNFSFEIELKEMTALQQLRRNAQFFENFVSLVLIAGMVMGNFSTKSPMNSFMGQTSKIIGHQFTKQFSNKKFSDVAGLKESKHEIQEFVEFLTKQKKFTDLGAKIPRGALLTGPPGTGKTLLIKALAGEAKVPFFAVSGSEFVELFVGVGAKRVRQIFKQAKEESPSIIFIDEIDAIGRKRQQGLGSNTESDSTLNQLLVEMDGFNTQQKVIVFGATNRKELLDDALLRPGRFDRQIDVQLPDIDERKAIYKIHLKKLKLKNEEKIVEKHAKRLASLSPGFSGADIANVCNEAAIYAVRNEHQFVKDIDFEMAIERVVGGLEKEYKGDENEKKIVAYHECGHGVVSWFLEGANPLLKLTIIPRTKGALGFAQYLPNEDSLQTEMELRHQIVSVLGGRVSEEHFFGKITTGAFDDLQKAYRIARALVAKLGMVDEIGLLSLEENSYGIKNYSDETNYKIDRECEKIILEATEQCRQIVKDHEQDIINLSEVLLQKSTIDLKDITKILGERPFVPKKNFKQYLEESLKFSSL